MSANKNEDAVFEIGELTIQIQDGKLIIFGSTEIEKTNEGRKTLDLIINELQTIKEGSFFEEKFEESIKNPETIKNPFKN